MKAFTYFLRAVAAFIFIVAACNTNIDNIPSYIIVTVLSFAIAVALWQCADVLDAPDEIPATAHSRHGHNNNRQTQHHQQQNRGQHTHPDQQSRKHHAHRLPAGGACTPERLQPSKQLKKGA